MKLIQIYMRHPLLITLCFVQTSLFAQDSMHVTTSLKPHMFGIIYDVAFFPKSDAGPAHLTSLEYTNKNKVPVSLRVNIAKRFSTTGMQLEADAYPLLNKKTYAFLNAGVADDILFPQYRAGISLFRALPSAVEAEGGFRFLYFKSPIWIYTGSIGKYFKNYWFNVSTFLTPEKGSFLHSYFFKTRYYFNEKSFMMVTLGTGISPDDRRNNNQLTGLKRVRSKRVDLSLKLFVKKYNVITLGAGVMKQIDQEKKSSNQASAIIGYHKIF